MEEVVILGADGRPVKGMQLDREMIHLGDANGAYMDCSRESVMKLAEERNERLKRNMQARPEVWRNLSTCLLSVKLAGFENPYDEINNLLLKAYTNTIEAQGAFLKIHELEIEMRRLRRRVIEEMTAKEIATEFILSSGNVEAFRKFCEERTERRPGDREETGKVRLFVR